MIRFQNLNLGAQFDKLLSKNPIMYTVVVAAADYVWRTYRQETVITSLYRPDDTDSVHAYWRGVDLRIEHPERNVRDEERGWSPSAAIEVCDWINSLFYYPDHRTAIIHGDGMEEHVHLQVPAGDWFVIVDYDFSTDAHYRKDSPVAISGPEGRLWDLENRLSNLEQYLAEGERFR